MPSHFREYATFRREALLGFTQIIGMLGPWALGALWTGIAAMDQAQSPLPTEGARRRERAHATAGGRASHTQECGTTPPPL